MITTIMSFFSRGSRRSVRGRGGRGKYLWNNNRARRMRVSVHFDTDSDEFSYFARIGQLALGPPPLPPVHSFRQPSFHNLQPHPSVVEYPRQPASINNDGWNPTPQPPPSGI